MYKRNSKIKSNLICLLILVAMFFVVPGQVFSEQIVIKVGSSVPMIDFESTPSMSVVQVFKSIVETESEGRIRVDIFPNCQLGSLTSMLEQVSRGTLEVSMLCNTGLLAAYYPEIQVLDLPYIWSNIEVVRAVLDGPFGEYLTEGLLEASGIRNLAWGPNSFRSFSNNVREIKTVEDMKGLRIRCQQIPIYVTTVRALGAVPVPVSWEELYIALKTGIVDGQSNPPWTTRIASLYEVQKYFTLDKNSLNIEGILMNEKFYQSLSPKDQSIVRYAARQAQFAYMGTILATKAGHLKFMAEQGLKITTLEPQERERFKNLALPAAIEQLKTQIPSEIVDFELAEIKAAEEMLLNKK